MSKLEILKSSEFFEEKDSIVESYTAPGVSEFVVNDKDLFIVYDEEGEQDLLNRYREASISAAMEDIPEIYHNYVEFNAFAEDAWQSIYDIYEVVDEVTFEGNTYYICSV